MTPQSLLLRQIHPSFIEEDGRPTSQAFRPTPKDPLFLSVNNGDRIDAPHAHARFVGISIGVQAPSYAECEVLELPVIEDGVPHPEHCSVDFSGLAGGGLKKRAQRLRDFAAVRGWLYRVAI